MRIAILGTRGIPNRYGGFERFAEVISTYFADAGNEVFVLSPEINCEDFGSVRVVSIAVPGWIPNNVQTLIYDFRSLAWASKNNVDVVLECGYSYAIWLIFFSSRFRKKIVTNPDGLEFKRKKWSFVAKTFLRICEKSAIRFSRFIVCDSPKLVNHYESKYSIVPAVIPYGAFAIDRSPLKSALVYYGIPDDYFLVISRFTPENSIDSILDCFSKNGLLLVVVGDYNNQYGKICFKKYSYYSNIRFLGGIYNQDDLNALRFYARAYIHGHSVGGTNPSLLEAMACKCFVIAHDNPYNRFVMDNRGLYFNNSKSLENSLKLFVEMNSEKILAARQQNHERILNEFTWKMAADRYLKVFYQL